MWKKTTFTTCSTNWEQGLQRTSGGESTLDRRVENNFPRRAVSDVGDDGDGEDGEDGVGEGDGGAGEEGREAEECLVVH